MAAAGAARFSRQPIVDLPDGDSIFHVICNLDDRYQVPGAQYLRSGRTYEYDGYQPHWRGIYDDRGRVVVAICNDMDLGDAGSGRTGRNTTRSFLHWPSASPPITLSIR